MLVVASNVEQGVTVDSISPGDGKTFPKKGGECHKTRLLRAGCLSETIHGRQSDDTLRGHSFGR